MRILMFVLLTLVGAAHATSPQEDALLLALSATPISAPAPTMDEFMWGRDETFCENCGMFVSSYPPESTYFKACKPFVQKDHVGKVWTSLRLFRDQFVFIQEKSGEWGLYGPTVTAERLARISDKPTAFVHHQQSNEMVKKLIGVTLIERCYQEFVVTYEDESTAREAGLCVFIQGKTNKMPGA